MTTYARAQVTHAEMKHRLILAGIVCCQHEVFSAYPTIDDTVVHCQCLRCRHAWKEVYVVNAAERFFREHGMRIKTLKELR